MNVDDKESSSKKSQKCKEGGKEQLGTSMDMCTEGAITPIQQNTENQTLLNSAPLSKDANTKETTKKHKPHRRRIGKYRVVESASITKKTENGSSEIRTQDAISAVKKLFKSLISIGFEHTKHSLQIDSHKDSIRNQNTLSLWNLFTKEHKKMYPYSNPKAIRCSFISYLNRALVFLYNIPYASNTEKVDAIAQKLKQELECIKAACIQNQSLSKIIKIIFRYIIRDAKTHKELIQAGNTYEENIYVLFEYIVEYYKEIKKVDIYTDKTFEKFNYDSDDDYNEATRLASKRTKMSKNMEVPLN